jgi:ABC-2 type transport system permease protein
MVVPALFMGISVSKPTTFAVVDGSGQVFNRLGAVLTDTTKTGERLYNLALEDAAGRSTDQMVKELGQRVTKGTIGGFIIIPPDVVKGGEAAFYAKNVSDFQRNEKLERAMEKAVREIRIGDSGMNAEQVAFVLKSVPLRTYKVGLTGESKKDEGATFGLAYVMGFIFYFALLIYGSMMLRAALEEKTSRSAEVMVATVRSSTLMSGKILGIGMVGLTQIAIWAAILGLLMSYTAAAPPAFMKNVDLSAIGLTFPMVLFFMLYFILGFVLYACLFGAIGAMVNSESEAQQLQWPVTVPIIMAFMVMLVAIRDPNATLVRIASLFPLFAPIVMTVRICVIMPPVWEIGLSLLILLASIWGCLWVAGRVFRVGLLMYGKRPNLPELMKWIRFG